ncbi:MAG: N-acetylglucosamine-6-phosphate deacetylase [Cyanobacteria bacterium J06634_6]
MSDSTVILNARLPQRPGLYQISIQDGKVCALAAVDPEGMAETQGAVLDVAGDWITLGAVDLQINGALGLAFPDLRLEDLETLAKICELLWQQGVDSFCPTLVTTSIENFQGSLAAIAAYKQSDQNSKKGRARILGTHLEGPFLNEAKRGAHSAKYLQPLTLENMKAVIGKFADTVSIMTLAPELAEERVIEWLRSHNITVSLGHSLATAQQANDAFAQGATMVTHAFNAMPGLHHREPGLLGAALTDSRVYCGFIADGQHICRTMLDLLLRVSRGSADTRLGGLFLVSDALSPLGLPDGKYPWDSREIEVVNGTARLADGTLSGTTLPLVEGAKNLVKWGICSVEAAIALVTLAPRKAIGAPVLSVGSSASLIRWSQNAEDQLVWQRLCL